MKETTGYFPSSPSYFEIGVCDGGSCPAALEMYMTHVRVPVDDYVHRR